MMITTNTKHCKFCEKELFKPILRISDEHWYFQKNNTIAGGTFVCKLRKRFNGSNWEKQNPEKAKAKHAKSKAKRRATKNGKIRHSISSNISIRLKNRGHSKSNHSVLNCLDYSIPELTAHLEKQFQPGMTWENYGKWHIDHIKPDSLFTYKTYNDKGFKDSWSLSNLQPLWAEDNLKKSNKYDGGARWQF